MPQRAKVIIIITNRLGLHARPAMAFVDLASSFASTVAVRRADGDEVCDGKSIMSMMMLAATKGTELEVTAEGDDAETACRKLKELADRGFDEP